VSKLTDGHPKATDVEVKHIAVSKAFLILRSRNQHTAKRSGANHSASVPRQRDGSCGFAQMGEVQFRIPNHYQQFEMPADELGSDA
jgi:hypothetical protein